MIERRAFVFGAAAAALLVGDAFGQEKAAPGGQAWDSQAEQTFGLGRGMGRRLMTEEEWREHQQKMRTLSGPERQRYREEVHQKMVERAKEKGITLPATPGPRGGGGPGPGPGPGPGGGTR